MKEQNSHLMSLYKIPEKYWLTQALIHPVPSQSLWLMLTGLTHWRVVMKMAYKSQSLSILPYICSRAEKQSCICLQSF